MVAPVHDRIGSVVNLARTLRSSMDMSRLETPVQTHTLTLLLDTIIELGTPASVQKTAETARKSVSAMMLPDTMDARPGVNRHGSRL